MNKEKSEIKKKVLMVIAQEKFRDEELATPKEVFLNSGFSVVIGSESLEEAVGKLGTRVKPDVEISKVNFMDFDAVVVVGGPGSRDYLWNNDILHRGLAALCAEGRVVSAICISPVVLARAGILKSKNATVYPDNEAIEELKNAGANYKNQDVVVDGNVVTGRDPQAAERFAREIINILNREDR